MSSDESGEHGPRVDVLGNPATGERIIAVDPADGATTVYEGTFPFLRDGGAVEGTVPVGTEPVNYGPPIEAGPLPDRDIETEPGREGPPDRRGP